MSNVTTVPNCPKCNSVGEVVRNNKQFVKLECPKCDYLWSTISPNCPRCKKPNGFAVEGVCSSCYSRKGIRY
jgi:phage FluMu protein Com